jgi:hypothetical protein
MGVRGDTFSCKSVCPRVVNPSPGLKGSGEPLFSVRKFVCPRVVTRVLERGFGGPPKVRWYVCPRSVTESSLEDGKFFFSTTTYGGAYVVVVMSVC